MTVSQEKSLWRRWAKQERQAISEQQRVLWDAKLCSHLSRFLRAQSAVEILIFYPVSGEPSLLQLVENLQGTCKFYLPIIDGPRQMHFSCWALGQPLRPNRFGIPEPAAPETQFSYGEAIKPVVLVPALAIDRKGMRLGFGGGYYDHFIKQHPAMDRIAVVYQRFLLPSLPFEPHDLPVASAATEQAIVPLELS